MDKRRGPMPIEERYKRFLASYSKHGGERKFFSHFEPLGEIDQCKEVFKVTGETVKPDSSGHYYLTCPGIEFHGNKSGRKDCRFTPGGRGSASNGVSAPSLHCVHQSCSHIIEQKNQELRSAIGKASAVYQSDHGSTLNNAAAIGVINFDLAPEKALEVLKEWGKACTPSHTALACGRAVEAAVEAYKKHPREVGSFLKSAAPSRATSASPRPPVGTSDASFASAHDLGELPSCAGVEQSAEPIYLGVKGKVAKAARMEIEASRADGYEPTCILLGPDQPEIKGKICGLPIERMRTHGISVHRETVDA